jgi:predicted Fe-Mo cluster-binding NifX family protein
MRLAVPVWTNVVSPVFDVAKHLLLVDVADGREITRQMESLGDTNLARRVESLIQMNVDLLICGSISRPLEAALLASGVQVIARISGEVERVLEAVLSDTLDESFQMPGCSRFMPPLGRCRRRGRRRRCGAGEGSMNPELNQERQRL